jgi:hypothetical protein
MSPHTRFGQQNHDGLVSANQSRFDELAAFFDRWTATFISVDVSLVGTKVPFLDRWDRIGLNPSSVFQKIVEARRGGSAPRA